MTPRPIQEDGLLHGVVVACCHPHDPSRFLCIRRSAHVAAPLQICFPGGGVEIGEDYESAAAREMQEELGAKVDQLRRVWQWSCDQRRLLLYGYRARLLTEPDLLVPDPHEVAEVFWLTDEEAATHPQAMATNRDFVEAIRAAATP